MAMYRPATILDELDELFAVPVARRRNTAQGFMPKLDVFEAKDQIVYQFDLPGLSKQNIDVSLHDNVLTVSGKYDDHSRSSASAPNTTTMTTSGKDKDREQVADVERHYKVRERPSGVFSRSVSVPNGLSPAEVVSKLENGVLQLTVPKVAKESQAKKITIM